ncbi:MAG: DUF805 domain-containing protein, partial [Caldisericia bacterium]|nr:DUF805 domain-containing protein [Caldisericia bacterium]
ARRKEYWTFALINILIAVIIGVIAFAGMTADATANSGGVTTGSNAGYIVSWLWSLIIFLPTLAVRVRRLHDTNRSGWYVFISLIPIVGWILMIVWMCTDSNLGENDYGPDPKAEEDVSFYGTNSI